MDETKYKFDYKEPENLKSAVPGEQKIRESDKSAIETTEWNEDNIVKSEDYILAPVVTVTKNEVTLTKGDMKLQKVTVTENVSEIRNGVFHTIKSPTYPPIFSDVIHQSPIRMDPNSQSEARSASSRPIRSLETQRSLPEERRTRIPTRFKSAVERVRRERSVPAKKVHETMPTHPRRSSIPRLKPKTSSPKPEDEFDRLFSEVANSPTDIDISLLNNKVEDPEKVEDCFEEIIHAYEENKIQPIVIETAKIENKVQAVTSEKPRSKIPMLKRKSEAEIEVPKSVQVNAKSSSVAVNSKFKDAVSKFSKADTNEPKPTSRIAVTKRTNGENDNDKTKTSYQRVRSITKDDKKQEVQIENIAQVSIEQDISADNVVNVDDVATQSTIEIVEITPSKVEEINEIVQSYTVEIIESPSTSIEEEITNSEIEIEEATEMELTGDVNKFSSSTTSNIKVEPVKVISQDELQTLMSQHSKALYNIDNFKPVAENNRNGNVVNNDYVISNYARDNNNTKSDIKKSTGLRDEENKVSKYNIEDRRPFLRKVENLNPKKDNETNGDEDPTIQNKSVLSKIAMFEKHRKDDSQVKPIPAVRCSYRRKLMEKEVLEADNKKEAKDLVKNSEYINKKDLLTTRPENNENDAVNTNEPDHTSITPEPKARHRNVYSGPIFSEVIKSNDHISSSDPNETFNQAVNEAFNNEINNNVIKSENSRISRMEIKTEEVAVSLAVEESVAENQEISEIKDVLPPNKTSIIKDTLPLQVGNKRVAVSSAVEESAVENQLISKIKDFVPPYKTSIIEDTLPLQRGEERVKRHLPNRYYSFEVDYAQEKRVNIEKAEETEIKSLMPVEIEFIEPVKIELNENENTAQDPVIVSHLYKSVYIENDRNKTTDIDSKQSPFDFTPKNPENMGNNYKISPTMSTEEILNAYRARTEDYNVRKAKSVAELDLGGAVKGKVKDLIVRMKLADKSVEKREVISAKERPRKKSVAEKIALFEIATTSAVGKQINEHHRNEQRRQEEVRTETEYNQLIKELEQAKQTYGTVEKMPSVTLSNGEVMPVLAVGTALLDPRLAANIIAAAIDLGYRAIDTAFIYGNEKEVGEGIRRKIEDGTVKRSDLFIISKLWSTFHRRDLVEEAYKKSLENLGLEYADLYLVHNPMSFKEGPNPIPKIAKVVQFSEHDFLDAWYGMEDLVANGLVKSIGLSNFNSSQVQKVMDKARIKPVINQVECHPYLSQQRLYNFCDERSIKLSCFGVLGSKGTPAEYKSSTVAAIDDPMVKVMAAGLKVSPAQLLIRYQLQSDHLVVVKASTGAHMWENLQALNFELTEGQMDALNALNRNKRTFTFKGMGDTHKNYPFNAPF